MIVFQLFWEFFKTGLFAVGGGLATLPFLQRMSEATGWFTTADIADLIAISESTPGPLGVNMGTYVGYKTLGIFGGLVSTIGLIFPSIVVIILISKILDKFRDSEIVKKVFYGFRPASTALITAAGLGVAKITMLHLDQYKESGKLLQLFNLPNIILGLLFFYAFSILSKKTIGGKKLNFHPIVYIAIAAVLGIIFKL